MNMLKMRGGSVFRHRFKWYNGVMRAGFTLIELLVVIAIVATLAAILLPVFAQARKGARMVGCLSNARQLAMAVQSYTQDFDEALPPSTNYAVPTSLPERIWTRLIQPYVRDTGVFTLSLIHI